MFDFSKLGDLSKLTNQAKDIQKRQDAQGLRQIELLEKISRKLEEILLTLKERR